MKELNTEEKKQKEMLENLEKKLCESSENIMNKRAK